MSSKDTDDPPPEAGLRNHPGVPRQRTSSSRVAGTGPSSLRVTGIGGNGGPDGNSGSRPADQSTGASPVAKQVAATEGESWTHCPHVVGRGRSDDEQPATAARSTAIVTGLPRTRELRSFNHKVRLLVCRLVNLGAHAPGPGADSSTLRTSGAHGNKRRRGRPASEPASAGEPSPAGETHRLGPRRLPARAASPAAAHSITTTRGAPTPRIVPAINPIRCDNSTCAASGNDQYYERNDHEADGGGRRLLR